MEQIPSVCCQQHSSNVCRSISCALLLQAKSCEFSLCFDFYEMPTRSFLLLLSSLLLDIVFMPTTISQTIEIAQPPFSPLILQSLIREVKTT